MIKKFILATGLLTSQAAFAWVDVSYEISLPKGAVYCTNQGNLDNFVDFVKDGDDNGANRMVDDGSCRVSNGMRIAVFQENEYVSCFLAPSGKAFYTLKGFLK